MGAIQDKAKTTITTPCPPSAGFLKEAMMESEEIRARLRIAVPNEKLKVAMEEFNEALDMKLSFEEINQRWDKVYRYVWSVSHVIGDINADWTDPIP